MTGDTQKNFLNTGIYTVPEAARLSNFNRTNPPLASRL
jgi:hypothetical protein